MTRSVFIAAPEGGSGKSAVALGVVDLLARTVERIGIFRPVVQRTHGPDPLLDLLQARPGVDTADEPVHGVDYAQLHENPEAAMAEIVDRFHAQAARVDAVVVLGSDYTDVAIGHESTTNAIVAANLGTPVLLVIPGKGRTPEEVDTVARLAVEEMRSHHAHVAGLVANIVRPEDVEEVRQLLAPHQDVPVGVIPDLPVLSSPQVRTLVEACEGTVVRGIPEWLVRESLGFVVAAMSMPNVLTRLIEDATVIAPGDRYDILPGLLLAHQSEAFPRLASIILTGGYTPPEPVMRLLAGSTSDVPIIVTHRDTFDTTTTLSRVRGAIDANAKVKIEKALRLFADHIEGTELLKVLDVGQSDAVTPLMFQHRLIEQARADRKHIVLPEGTELRILEATASILRLGVADITLLGDARVITETAAAAGLDIDGARIVSPHDPELVERFATVYTDLRAHKGMTLEHAREVVTDVSYFGTMMVYLGLADGMVSGAAHTTAHTIRPSFEVIRTRPGTGIVSSVFLMCLADRVLFYADCAVNPDPSAEELADIAISSAATAERFGTEPRVAMLSYSTGSSGAGADVDKVRRATEIVRERAPGLLVEGPIQYDAAVVPSVARSKAPDSPVAGHATVLVFPDLNTGNNTYKAVQRSAGAVAIGPVLQGLNRPVNDLSRGALVEDIVNTVAITAIQAQGQAS